MNAIDGLKPEMLWKRFEELSAIPRNSKNEAESRKLIIEKARKCGFDYKTDKAGNLVVRIPARASTIEKPVILQAHLDMICEKNTDNRHDFRKHPITLVKDGDWIKADGTTLGADNGIACAAMIAIMEDTSLTHPGLELLFTVDEEIGLAGAIKMDPSLINGRTLINLDSEEDGILYIGCAGGKETDLRFYIERGKTPRGYKALLLRVSGLKGGHSGTDIHDGRGNAIKILASLLASAGLDFRLSMISGGNLHNSIPREAEAVIVVRPSALDRLRVYSETVLNRYRKILKGVDEGIDISIVDTPLPRDFILRMDASRLIETLNAIPSGITSADLSLCMIKTSTNLGVLKTENDSIIIKTMQRSIHLESMAELAGRVASIGRLAGAEVIYGNEFPAWKPDIDSGILKVCKQCYLELFGSEPEVKVIHAGLECGVIADKIPGMETISFGPTIEYAHSPFERVRIESVNNFWEYLKTLLNKLAI